MHHMSLKCIWLMSDYMMDTYYGDIFLVGFHDSNESQLL